MGEPALEKVKTLLSLCLILKLWLRDYIKPMHTPQTVVKTKKMDEEDRDKEILNIFMKVAVNIPFLDVIKQVLKHAKFLKDFCTHKTILKGNERVNKGRNVLVFIHHMLVLERSLMGQNVSALTYTMP